MEKQIAKHTGLIMTLAILLLLGGLFSINTFKLNTIKLLNDIITPQSPPNSIQLIRAEGAPFVTYRIHAPYITEAEPTDLTITLLPPRIINGNTVSFNQGDYLRGMQVNGASYQITQQGNSYKIEITNISSQNTPLLGTIMLNVPTSIFISQDVDIESNNRIITITKERFPGRIVKPENRITNTSPELIYYPDLHTPQLMGPGQTIMTDSSTFVGYVPLRPAKFTQFQEDPQLTYNTAQAFTDVYFPNLPSLSIEEDTIKVPFIESANFNTLILELTELNGFKQYRAHNLKIDGALPISMKSSQLLNYYQSVKYAWAFLEPANAQTQNVWLSLNEQNLNYMSQFRNLTPIISQYSSLTQNTHDITLKLVQTLTDETDPANPIPIISKPSYLAFIASEKTSSTYQAVKTLLTQKRKVYRNQLEVSLKTKETPATLNILTRDNVLYSKELSDSNTIHLHDFQNIPILQTEEWKTKVWTPSSQSSLLCVGETSKGQTYSIPYQYNAILTVGDCFSSPHLTPNITKLYFYEYDHQLSSFSQLGSTKVLHQNTNRSISLFSYDYTNHKVNLTENPNTEESIQSILYNDAELTNPTLASNTLSTTGFTFDTPPVCTTNCFMTLQTVKSEGEKINISPIKKVHKLPTKINEDHYFCPTNQKALIASLVTDQKLKATFIPRFGIATASQSTSRTDLVYQAATGCFRTNGVSASELSRGVAKMSSSSATSETISEPTFTIYPQYFQAIQKESSDQKNNLTNINIIIHQPILRSKSQLAQPITNSIKESQSTTTIAQTSNLTPIQTSLFTPSLDAYNPLDKRNTRSPSSFSTAVPSYRTNSETYLPHLEYNFSADQLLRNPTLIQNESINLSFNVIPNGASTLNFTNTTRNSTILNAPQITAESMTLNNPMGTISFPITIQNSLTTMNSLAFTQKDPPLTPPSSLTSPAITVPMNLTFQSANPSMQENIQLPSAIRGKTYTANLPIGTLLDSLTHSIGQSTVSLPCRQTFSVTNQTITANIPEGFPETSCSITTSITLTEAVSGITHTNTSKLNFQINFTNSPPGPVLRNYNFELPNGIEFGRTEIFYPESIAINGGATNLFKQNGMNIEYNPTTNRIIITGTPVAFNTPETIKIQATGLISQLQYHFLINFHPAKDIEVLVPLFTGFDNFFNIQTFLEERLTIPSFNYSSLVPNSISSENWNSFTPINSTIISATQYNRNSKMLRITDLSAAQNHIIVFRAQTPQDTLYIKTRLNTQAPQSTTLQPINFSGGERVSINLNSTIPPSQSLRRTYQVENDSLFLFNGISKLRATLLDQDQTLSLTIKDTANKEIFILPVEITSSTKTTTNNPDLTGRVACRSNDPLTPSIIGGICENKITYNPGIEENEARQDCQLRGGTFKLAAGPQSCPANTICQIFSHQCTGSFDPSNFQEVIETVGTTPPNCTSSNIVAYYSPNQLKCQSTCELETLKTDSNDTSWREATQAECRESCNGAAVEVYYKDDSTGECKTYGDGCSVPLNFPPTNSTFRSATPTECQPLHGTAECFPDITPLSALYKAEICKAKTQNIITGANGNFLPQNFLNRAEATKVLITGPGFKFNLSNQAEIEQIKFENISKPFVIYNDVPGSEWYMPYIVKATNFNIVSGYKDGTYQPSREVNFAESAKLIVNTIRTFASPDSKLTQTYNSCLNTQQPWYYPFVQTINLNGGDFHPVNNSSAIALSIKRDQFIYNTMLMLTAAESTGQASLCGESTAVVAPVSITGSTETSTNSNTTKNEAESQLTNTQDNCQIGVFWGRNNTAQTCKLFTSSCINDGYTFLGQTATSCDCSTLEDPTSFSATECKKVN